MSTSMRKSPRHIAEMYRRDISPRYIAEIYRHFVPPPTTPRSPYATPPPTKLLCTPPPPHPAPRSPLVHASASVGDRLHLLIESLPDSTRMIGAAGGRVYVLMRKARGINRRDKSPRCTGRRVYVLMRKARVIVACISRPCISAIYLGYLSRRRSSCPQSSASHSAPSPRSTLNSSCCRHRQSEKCPRYMPEIYPRYMPELLLPPQVDISAISRPYLGLISGVSRVWSGCGY